MTATGPVLKRIHQTAVGLGLATEQETLLGRPTVVARRSDFKLKWIATRMHTFVVASAFDAARQYAVDHKGGLPRGLQTGSAAISVAVVPSCAPGTEEWALKPHGRRFAALAFPVLADVSSGAIVQPNRMIVGGIYAPHFRRVLLDVVGPAMQGGG